LLTCGDTKYQRGHQSATSCYLTAMKLRSFQDPELAARLIARLAAEAHRVAAKPSRLAASHSSVTLVVTSRDGDAE
jgi:hypothetical protein